MTNPKLTICTQCIHRFHVLHTSIMLKHDRIEVVVMAACILHNILRSRNPMNANLDFEDPETHDVIAGSWRMDHPLQGTGTQPQGNRGTEVAKTQRNQLRDYYTSPASSIPWQDSKI